MKKFAISLLTIAFLVLTQSCDNDSSTSPQDESNRYFPVKIGASWTYNNYSIDSLGQKEEKSVDYETIVTVVADTAIKGKDCFSFKETYQNNVVENKYYYSTQYQIYVYDDLLPTLNFDIPFEIPVDWYKIADSQKNQWEVYADTIENKEFETALGNAVANGYLTITGYYEGKETINYGENLGKSVECQKYKLVYQFEGSAEISGVSVPIDFSVSARRWYASDIGLVKSNFSAVNFKVKTLIGEFPIYYPGREKVLISTSYEEGV